MPWMRKQIFMGTLGLLEGGTIMQGKLEHKHRSAHPATAAKVVLKGIFEERQNVFEMQRSQMIL